MALNVPDVGLKQVIMLLQAGFPQLFVRLFQNDYTPAAGSVLANFTEATFSGYVAGTIQPGAAGWPGAPLLGAANHRYQITAGNVAYNGTGAGITNTIYGYYVCDQANNLWWAERLPGAPFTMGAAGSNLTITPTLTDRSEF